MTLSINSFSLPRQYVGSGWIKGSYPWVTSGSVVSTNPHWLLPPEPARDSLLPPALSSAPTVTPLSLWSRTGIGATLAMIVDYTRSPGMTRTYILHFNCYIFFVCQHICHCHPVLVPQSCLYPTLSPCSTVASVAPDCDSIELLHRT